MNNCKCIKKIVTTSVEVSGSGDDTEIIYKIPPIEFENMKDYLLIFAQKLPLGSNLGKIIIDNGTTKLFLVTRSANYLRADEIKCRKAFPIVYGNDPEHLSLKCLVPNTAFTVEPPPTKEV